MYYNIDKDTFKECVMRQTIKSDCNVFDKDSVEKVKASIPKNLFNSMQSILSVLADPTRLKIVYFLSQNEFCVSDISVLLNMSKSAISHQLSLLKKTSIIEPRREGKNLYYSIASDKSDIIQALFLIFINK